MHPFNALAKEVVRCVKGDATNEKLKITGMISRILRCGAIALLIPHGNHRHNAEVRMRALLGEEECPIMKQNAKITFHPPNLSTSQVTTLC